MNHRGRDFRKKLMHNKNIQKEFSEKPYGLGTKTFKEEELLQGTKCPCCDRFIKMYKRTITSAMAYGLILLQRKGKGDWIHLRQFFTSRNMRAMNDVPTLVFWDLLEKKDDYYRSGNNAGFYRVTPQGEDFVTGSIMLPKYVYILNGKLKKYGQEKFVGIEECLNDKFAYEKLMRGEYDV